MPTSLYTKYGGAAAISQIVRGYYRRVLHDPALGSRFAGVDLDVLIAHQMNFLGQALGGPEVYEGRDLHAVHAPLVIDDAAFDTSRAHLTDALVDAGVESADRDRVLELIDALRDQIVTEKPES